MIGIIGAMDEEILALLDILEEKEEIDIFGRIFYKGKISNKSVVICRCHIGKVNAALTTTLLISNFDIDLIINIGVAGGVSPTKVNDIIVCNKTMFHDCDLTCIEGIEKGLMSGMPLYYDTDNSINEIVFDALKEYNFSYREGVIATGDEFVTSLETRMDFINKHSIVAVEMESAAIAQVAYVMNTKYTILRSISDVTDEEGNEVLFDEFLSEACEKITKVVHYVVKHL